MAFALHRKEHQFCRPPGTFQSFGRNGEIRQGGRLIVDIDQAPVWQLRCPIRGKQQALALHRGKILAVDPDKVDGAMLVAPGRLFGKHGRHRLGGIVQLDLHDGDAIARLHRFTGPLDIGVDIG